MQFNELATDEVLQTTKQALEQNGFSVHIAENTDQAKEFAQQLIPQGSEVMTMTSETLSTLGLEDHFNNSETYQPVREKFYSMNAESDAVAKLKLGAAPEYTIGSVHAITQDGKVLVASNTGSQLPAYAYGSAHVVWVVGAQKIVKNFEEGMQRINEYVLPLESERARKAYGVEGSFVSKLLVFNKEVNPERINIILVKQQLGF